MFLKDICDQIGDSVNDTTLKSTGANYQRTKQFVNEFMFSEFLVLRDWWFTKRQGTVSTVAQYTTGSATFTFGSATVTGTGTTWTSAMIGRYIVVDGEREYKISAFGSTTSITIESAYEETTKTSSYRIVQYVYSLPRWVDFPLRIEFIAGPTSGGNLSQRLINALARPFQAINSYGYLPGPRVRTTYTTGTISGTMGGSTITGISTLWATTAALEPGDVIQVGSYAYTIASVDSATSVTTVQSIVVTFSGATYIALKDRWTIEFTSYPTTAQTLYLKASAIVTPLVNDYDVPILPDSWHYILVKGGRCHAIKHNGEDSQIELVELQNAIKKLIYINATYSDRLERITY